MRPRLAGLLLAVIWLAAPQARAHVTSTGLATVETIDADVRYRLLLSPDDLAVDLAAALMRAAEGDAAVSARLTQVMQAAVTLRAGAEPCQPAQSAVAWLPERRQLRLEMAFRCSTVGAALTLAEDWRELLGEHHRNIVSVRRTDGTREHILGPDNREARLDLAAPGGGWWDFITLGVEHILSGLDHLLFLLALLVNQRRAWPVVGIVSAFTVAHSITLSLATLQLVSLSPRLVEPAIAASIVWVAVENLLVAGAAWRRMAVAFVFGLLHGLGFAGALGELGLQGGALLRALVGFNLGVELGQVACVLAVLPLFVWLSRPPAMARLPQVASVVVALMGAFWFVERVFLR